MKINITKEWCIELEDEAESVSAISQALQKQMEAASKAEKLTEEKQGKPAREATKRAFKAAHVAKKGGAS